MQPSFSHRLDFDIDRYLNLYIPHNRLAQIPRPIAHFLGHRHEPQQEPSAPIQWLFTFLATVAGLCLVAGVYSYTPGITRLNPPVVLASLGASAVLEYNAVRSPLAQPRNAILGHTLAAMVGAGISKLFQLSLHYNEISWVSAAVGCACASLVMSMTNTVHPPGGATAVLASTQAQIIFLGWMFVPLVLLGSLLMMAVALLFNNVMRQYPVYWWTPGNVGRQLRRAEVKAKGVDAEAGGKEAERLRSESSSERTVRKELSNVSFVDGADAVSVSPYHVNLPSHIELTPEETLLLENLQERLQRRSEVT